ncbi:hypothetical protein MAR_035615, partial [Mya arenaria]
MCSKSGKAKKNSCEKNEASDCEFTTERCVTFQAMMKTSTTKQQKQAPSPPWNHCEDSYEVTSHPRLIEGPIPTTEPLKIHTKLRLIPVSLKAPSSPWNHCEDSYEKVPVSRVSDRGPYRPRAFLEVSLMSQWQDWNSKKMRNSRFPDPNPSQLPSVLEEIAQQPLLRLQPPPGPERFWKNAQQSASPTPPHPGSRAFLDVSISLMPQWLYDRTGSKMPHSRFSDHGPVRLPSVSGCFYLIDVT